MSGERLSVFLGGFFSHDSYSIGMSERRIVDSSALLALTAARIRARVSSNDSGFIPQLIRYLSKRRSSSGGTAFHNSGSTASPLFRSSS